MECCSLEFVFPGRPIQNRLVIPPALTTPLGKHLDLGYGVLVQLKLLLEKAGLPDIRFHDLRHSAASLFLAMDVHPKIVQEILGHSEISMTMDIYSHVLPTMQKNAMDKLNQAFAAFADMSKEEGKEDKPLEGGDASQEGEQPQK